MTRPPPAVASPGRTLLALLVLVPASLLAEVAGLVLLLRATGPLALQQQLSLLGLHCFAAVAGAEALRLRYPAGEGAGFAAWRLGLGLGLLLPLYGQVASGLLAFLRPRPLRVSLEDLLSPMEHRQQQAEAELAAEAGRGRADADVEALGDALKDADKMKRLGAVEALRALQNKEAVQLLNRSLKNTVFEVRYHAVEALAGINQKHSARIAAATAELERDPSPANHRALGEVTYEFASMEMEDPSIQQHLFRNAVDHLRRSLAPGQPVDLEVLVHTAISLEQLGETDQAWHTYRAALAQQPDCFEALLGVARLQYRQAQFDQLRDTCRRLLELPAPGLDPQVGEVLALWAEGLPDDASPPSRAGG